MYVCAKIWLLCGLNFKITTAREISFDQILRIEI